MSADAILAELLDRGITPAVTPDGTGIEVPAGRLTDAEKAAIRAHKPELIAAIQESARQTSELLTAAMRACDAWSDSPAARDQMRREVLETPPHLRADLRELFLNTYPKGNPA